MKYLKLFENWLNEAEEGKSEVKPFDPAKPFETLIVDITNEDFSKAPEVKQKYIIGSILAKCFDKTEKVDDSKISVKQFTQGESGSLTGPGLRIILVNEDGSQFKAITGKVTNEEQDKLMNAKEFFLVTLADDNYEKDSTIKRDSKKRFLIAPMESKSDSDFLLNSKWLVYCHSTSEPETIFETTLGNFSALATNKFDNLAVLKDANAGKPQSIAKALGYEIPDNYAPKQGVKFEDRP